MLDLWPLRSVLLTAASAYKDLMKACCCIAIDMVFIFIDIDVCTAGVRLWRGELCGGQCGGHAESAHWRPMGSDLPRAAAV